ncbi:MAG: hypothetical protein N4A35_05065 [Flavobacteriales bacterium]|jgi:ribosome-associated toxin RatA of RatAB toxin-antitoxin module|nr:hypothetical protein [Flavobacteriales bacterium]
MPRIIEKKLINEEIQTLFEFTQDFEKRVQWDSQTQSINYINAEKQLKKGAQVTVISSNGVRMDTEYTTFTPPHQIAIKMLNQSPIFRAFNGSWIYKRISANQTELTILYEFKLQPLYRLLQPIVLKKTRKNMRNKLEDLAYTIVNR